MNNKCIWRVTTAQKYTIAYHKKNINSKLYFATPLNVKIITCNMFGIAYKAILFCSAVEKKVVNIYTQHKARLVQ
jgi:hypothetical protein